jgi:hypothetical protein
MLTATKPIKIDPIFAAIEAHRQATGERYIILKALCGMKDGAPERGVTEDAHDRAAEVEIAATKKLRKIRPTTIAGAMAVTAYFVEHRDRYPLWIGGEIEPKPGSIDYPEPRTFEDSMIRNLAAALARINSAKAAA